MLLVVFIKVLLKVKISSSEWHPNVLCICCSEYEEIFELVSVLQAAGSSLWSSLAYGFGATIEIETSWMGNAYGLGAAIEILPVSY